MQGTSTKWKLRRDAAQLQTEIPVEKFATVERALREADKFDLVIFDGPAHAKKGGLTMGKKSTIILMPTCYGLDDLEARIEAAYELEEKGSTRPVSGVVSQLVAVVTPLVLGKGWVVETQPEPKDHHDDR